MPKLLSPKTFAEIWLNEGFASYCEALWFEYSYPPYTASEYQMMYQLYLGPGTVYVEHPEYENIFDSNLPMIKEGKITKKDVLKKIRHFYAKDCGQNIYEELMELLKKYQYKKHNYLGNKLLKMEVL